MNSTFKMPQKYKNFLIYHISFPDKPPADAFFLQAVVELVVLHPQSGATSSSLGDCETKRSSTRSGRKCST